MSFDENILLISYKFSQHVIHFAKLHQIYLNINQDLNMKTVTKKKKRLINISELANFVCNMHQTVREQTGATLGMEN